MPTPLPPFDSKAKCPKCCDSDADTWHVPVGELCANLNPEGDCCHRAQREHMERHCRRCHYIWAEAPLDAKESGQ